MELDELKKFRATMEDTARSMQDTVTKGVSETEGELNKLAQSAQPETGPEPAPPDAKLAPAQLDLALDQSANAPPQKQA